MMASEAMAKAAILTVIFPVAGGACLQAGLPYLGWGLFSAALVTLGIGMMAYLERPHRPGPFQSVDLRSRQLTELDP